MATNNYVKGASMDKWEAYRPTNSPFMNSTSEVGMKDANFSVRCGYAWNANRRSRGFGYGVDKKLYHASGQGILIDSYYVGKGDE